jgi:hypothetical protein
VALMLNFARNIILDPRVFSDRAHGSHGVALQAGPFSARISSMPADSSPLLGFLGPNFLAYSMLPLQRISAFLCSTPLCSTPILLPEFPELFCGPCACTVAASPCFGHTGHWGAGDARAGDLPASCIYS